MLINLINQKHHKKSSESNFSKLNGFYSIRNSIKNALYKIIIQNSDFYNLCQTVSIILVKPHNKIKPHITILLFVK